MAACINALSLALLQTSIPSKASIVAVCTSEIDPGSRRRFHFAFLHILPYVLGNRFCNICVFKAFALKSALNYPCAPIAFVF